VAIFESAVAGGTGTGTGSLPSQAFSPPAGSLLVALAAAGYGTNATPGITLSDSVSGSWTAGPTVGNAAGQWRGRVSIFTRYVIDAPGSMTVTAAFTNLTGGRHLTVAVLTGANADQSTAGSATRDISAATTAWTQAITTTKVGSVVYGICQDPNTNATLTAAANTTLVGTPFNNATDMVVSAVGASTAATVTPGSVTLGFTNSTSATGVVALVEVLPMSTVRRLTALGVG
jgi:hypothetical protein